MSNTTSNIKSEYNSLAADGNLHDFTAAELYDIGSASYLPKTRGVSYEITEEGGAPTNIYAYTPEEFISVEGLSTNSLYSGAEVGSKVGVYYLPIPTLVVDRDTSLEYDYYTRTYHIDLNPKLSTGLFRTFAEAKEKTSLASFDFVVSEKYAKNGTLPANIQALETFLSHWKEKTKTTPETKPTVADITTYINGPTIFTTDYEAFTKLINSKTQNIYSVMTTTDTPLALYIQQNFANEVDYRFFKSLNVTATKDNIFYKVIDSNVEDKINTMILFGDSNGRLGNKLYSTNDWSPYNSKVAIYNTSGNEYPAGTDLTAFKIPADFNEVAVTELYTRDQIEDGKWSDEAKFAYAQILQIRFKRMLSGNRTTNKLDKILNTLAGINKDYKTYAIDFFTDEETMEAYDEYYDTWKVNNNESVTISTNGNIVFSWVEALGTPQNCTLSNWTGRLSIVNPQHLSANDKRVLDPSELTSFTPFNVWYQATYGKQPVGEINAEEVKNWFNSLTINQFNFWIDPSSCSENVMVYSNIPNGISITVNKSDSRGDDGKGNFNWNGINKQFIVDCGGYNQVIWGCGITPDFMYPVVDISRPTPNVKTECLVYCNDAGYKTIKLAFINSPVEEYIVAKFKPGVDGNRQNQIVAQINEWAKDGMIFPDNVKSAYFRNETSNILNCSGFRIAYIPDLVHTIDIVSIILCLFIAILSFIICFVIIKRYVERNRVNIGIMRANGISKIKIALSLFPFALVPAVIGGIAAYITGLLLQAPTLSLFKNYWTLPTPLISFDWLSMIICILVPFLLFGLICFIATMLVLRTKSVELMKAGSEFKANQFSRIVKKPFKHFGILARFRISLAFNSVSRLVMMALMSCLTMTSLVFAFTTFDKLNQSRQINSSQFDYSFSLKLTTPTASGSTYSTYDYSTLGIADPVQHLYNTNWDTSNSELPDYTDLTYSELTRWYSHESLEPSFLESTDKRTIINKNGNLMMPSAADMTGQNVDLTYLADKVSSRLTMDYNLGASFIGATSNPWEIALSLMPSNSRNLAADAFDKVIEKIGQGIEQATNVFESECAPSEKGYRDDEEKAKAAGEKAGKWFYLGDKGFYEWDETTWEYKWQADYYNKLSDYVAYNKDTKKYELKVHDWLTGFTPAFTHMLVTAYNDEEIVKLEYPIAYRTIPINWDWNKQETKKDELYTYIEANFEEISGNNNFDKAHEITIEGIKNDSQYIFLTDTKGNEINSYLFSENYLNSLNVNGNVHPIIVNSYAAHKYNLKVGSTITIHANNTVERFNRKIHPDKFSDDLCKATFKVVGISAGTNGEAFYTTQEIANDVLGLPNGRNWNRTHRYMRWQSQENYDDGEAPELVDLAGINSDSGHITKYNFETLDESKQPTIDKSIVMKNPNVPTGFNGIYTKNTSGKPLTNGVTLYSYTGMYPGTSVYKTKGSVNKFAEILGNGSNLAIANLMTGIDDIQYYEANSKYLAGELEKEVYTEQYIKPFIDQVTAIYGETTMVTGICGAMDVAATDLIYTNLISTFNLAETTIMSIVIPITIIIVIIISNLIIIDSKKMAAMLKALGYSDAKNLMSILALFIPTIVIGLALAIPLSFGMLMGYQAIIFTSANILVDITQKWWFYVAAVGGIGVILLAAYGLGYASLKKNRLVDEIK